MTLHTDPAVTAWHHAIGDRCDHRYQGDGLRCVRHPHPGAGHVYHASDAPKVRDTEACQEDQ